MARSSFQFLTEQTDKITQAFICIRVPADRVAEARRLANKHHVSLSAFVRAGIEKMIHDLKPAKPKQEHFEWK